MKLTQLASSLPDSPEVFGEAEIAGLACDSRKVKAGDLYFCLPGLRVDGHSFEELEAAFAQAKETKDRPFAIVMKTTKGKGVSYMENAVDWHGKAPNDAEYETAMDELRAALAELEAQA